MSERLLLCQHRKMHCDIEEFSLRNISQSANFTMMVISAALGEVKLKITAPMIALCNTTGTNARTAEPSNRSRACSLKPREVYIWITLLHCLFYSIPVIASPSGSRFSCAENLPKIEHANVLPQTNNSYARYTCLQEFRMIDPLTMEPSPGVLECSNNDEWFPKPYPECRPDEPAKTPEIQPETSAEYDADSSYACECPHEELEGIRVSEVVSSEHPKGRGLHLPSSSPRYNIGDILKLDCNVSDNDRARFNTKPEDFVVYPSAIRICQPDCTWSGPPPVCLDPSKPMLHNIVPVISAKKCSNVDCLEQTNKWKQIGGSLSAERLPRSEVLMKSKSIKMFIVEFPRHVYLSSMTVEPMDGEGSPLRKFDVQLKMNSQVEIENVSNDSRSVVNAQYNNLALPKRGGELIKVNAYTRQIFVKVSAESTSNWSPGITFYAVPELGMKGLKGSKCSTPPSIPNAIMKVSTDGMNVQYICNKGYQLKIPRRGEASGNLSCHNGFEWSPYPFPVCHLTNSSSSDSNHDEPDSFTGHYSDSRKIDSYHRFTHTDDDVEHYSILSPEAANGKARVPNVLNFAFVVGLVGISFIGCTGTIITMFVFFVLKRRKYFRLSEIFTPLFQTRSRVLYQSDYAYPVFLSDETKRVAPL